MKSAQPSMRALFVDTNTRRIVPRRVSPRWLAQRVPIAYIPNIDIVVYMMSAVGRGSGMVEGTYVRGQLLLVGVADDGSDKDVPDQIAIALRL
jgi:hypothetical protein